MYCVRKWCVVVMCACVYLTADAQVASDPNPPPATSFNYQDIVVTAAFKPSIRNSSKIAFLPDLSSSIDSPTRQKYDYSLRLLPAGIGYYVGSANIGAVGFFDYSEAIPKTQYFSAGYGNQGRLNMAFHVNAFPKSKNGDLRVLGNLETFSPSNRLYRKDYDFNVGFLGRLNVKDKHQLGIQYKLNLARYRSNFYNEASTPNLILIPHTGQEMRLTFDNQKSTASKIFYMAQVGFNTFGTNFTNQPFQQSEFSFFAGVPLSVTLNEQWKINLKPSIETYHFESKNDTLPQLSVDNHIARASFNVQYFKDNVNAYLGATIYGSTPYGFRVYPEIFFHYGMGKASPFFVEGLFTTKQFYQSLSSFKENNPYIQSDSAFGTVLQIQSQIAAQYNVKERFNLRLSAEWNIYQNLNLVTNRWSDNYALFSLVKEASLSELVIRNDYIYVEPEKYELGLTITKTIIIEQKTLKQPIGRLYPLFEAYAVYKPLHHLKLRASFFGYDKVYYQDPAGYFVQTTTGIYDLGFYGEYAFLKNEKLRAWMDMKNILSKPYERWSGYQHPGFLISFGVSLFL